jgi:hypothetical protein
MRIAYWTTDEVNADLAARSGAAVAVDSGSSPCVLYYSEVADFAAATGPRHRAKVQLADAIQAAIQGAKRQRALSCLSWREHKCPWQQARWFAKNAFCQR